MGECFAMAGEIGDFGGFCASSRRLIGILIVSLSVAGRFSVVRLNGSSFNCKTGEINPKIF